MWQFVCAFWGPFAAFLTGTFRWIVAHIGMSLSDLAVTMSVYVRACVYVFGCDVHFVLLWTNKTGKVRFEL